MIVKIKLSDSASLPVYAKLGDGAMDLVATSKEVVEQDGYGYIEYKTGISLEIPEGYVGLLFPRSSVSKTGLVVATSGVIDSGYRGEVSYRYKYIKGAIQYEVGDKVCQLMIVPIPEIEWLVSDELSETERGDGAYGSTGK